MKHMFPQMLSISLTRRYVTIASLTVMALSTSLLANAPSWWSARGVIATDSTTGQPMPADDYAVINQGQIKEFAAAAAAELNANLPGGAGTAINSLITSWATPTAATDDYVVANIGQLKAVAKLFYDRLIATGYTDAYPWTNATRPADDYAAANIGQAKNLFSFDVTYESNSADGVPDWWEKKYFGNNSANWLVGSASAPNGALNSDGSPLTILEAFEQQKDPVN